MSDMLTEHFSRREFLASETAARRGIDNVPGDTEWENMKALCETCLEPARAALGPLHINSGYRCPALNTAIGGAVGSQHIRGEAADVIPLRGALSDLFSWLHGNVPYDQILWEYSQWVHISHVRDGPQRKQVLMATRSNGRTLYTPITAEQMLAL